MKFNYINKLKELTKKIHSTTFPASPLSDEKSILYEGIKIDAFLDEIIAELKHIITEANTHLDEYVKVNNDYNLLLQKQRVASGETDTIKISSDQANQMSVDTSSVESLDLIKRVARLEKELKNLQDSYLTTKKNLNEVKSYFQILYKKFKPDS